MATPLLLSQCSQVETSSPTLHTFSELDEALAKPVLKRNLFKSPVMIDKVELKLYEGNYICVVTSKEGAVGISVSNNAKMSLLFPIFVKNIQPFFIGKDARDLEKLIDEVYVYKSNYKMQNLALWVPLATIEFAILDLLGKIAGEPIGNLIGEVHHPQISVYQANNFRGKSAEESIELIKKQVGESKPNALKFKIGGRMSNNADYPPGRTEKLIPLVRKAFGDDMVIYADSNGSYTTDEAIRVGKILEEYKIAFYEEPVPFDWYEETKQVKEGLNIKIAGGEQEPSMHNFRWLIQNNALDIVQPDIFYFGGMIRSMRVARMAEVKGKICIPHISGSGLGYLYMMHFVSAVSNAGPHHEFKGFNKKIPIVGTSSSLDIKGGKVEVPTGPGLGIEIDKEYIDKHQLVLV